jgi:fermentation-respiration switch protein FrsA (DUF1100 family)
MRGLGNILGLLIVAGIALLVYKFYFTSSQPGATATPMQTIDIVGVKNDLIAIAQAERAYMAEHGAYTSLDQLTSSGALTMTRTSRDGYTYEVQVYEADFHAVAHCPTATQPGCKDYVVGPSMEVEPAP